MSARIRVFGFIAAMFGLGVLAYCDERVLGFLITSLALGLLVFGVGGIALAAWAILRAALRWAPDERKPQNASAQTGKPPASTALASGRP